MSKPSITFATCLEAGQIAPALVMMVRSLREFGGRLKDSPVVAVKTRLNVPVDRGVLRTCEELGVRVVDASKGRPYDWYQFVNKTLTCKIVAAEAKTDLVGWLDHDLLFLQEPDAFLLPDDVDFSAALNDVPFIEPATSAQDLVYWNAVRQAQQLSAETAVTLSPYLNGGVFIFRRSTGFAEAYYDDVNRGLGAKFWHRTSGAYFLEQMTVAFTAERLRLRRVLIDHDYNFAVTPSKLDAGQSLATLHAASVLHYHDTLRSSRRADVLAALPGHNARVTTWLAEHDSTLAREPTVYRWGRTALRGWRSRRRDAHAKTCRRL